MNKNHKSFSPTTSSMQTQAFRFAQNSQLAFDMCDFFQLGKNYLKPSPGHIYLHFNPKLQQEKSFCKKMGTFKHNNLSGHSLFLH